MVVVVVLVVLVVLVEADDDDNDDDAAAPTLHLLACWPAVGRQSLKSGQGPAGPTWPCPCRTASLLSEGERGRRPCRRRPGTSKTPLCFTVFFAVPIFPNFSALVAQDGSTWAIGSPKSASCKGESSMFALPDSRLAVANPR